MNFSAVHWLIPPGHLNGHSQFLIQLAMVLSSLGIAVIPPALDYRDSELGVYPYGRTEPRHPSVWPLALLASTYLILSGVVLIVFNLLPSANAATPLLEGSYLGDVAELGYRCLGVLTVVFTASLLVSFFKVEPLRYWWTPSRPWLLLRRMRDLATYAAIIGGLTLAVLYVPYF